MIDEIKQRDLLVWAEAQARFFGECGDLEMPDEIAFRFVRDSFAEQMRDYVISVIDDDGLVEYFDWEELDGDELEEEVTKAAREFVEKMNFNDVAEPFAEDYIEEIKYGF